MLLLCKTGQRRGMKLIVECGLSEFNVGFPIHMPIYSTLSIPSTVKKSFAGTYPT